MTRAILAAAAVLLAAQTWACHDSPSPWEPPEEVIPPGARQISFSPGHDRSPAWSTGGDSIVYVAEGFGDLARSDGVLVVIPLEGGSLGSVFPVLQPARTTAAAVAAPAVEPGTGRIAYAQVLQVPGVCAGEWASCDATGDPPAPPRLQLGRVRVRTPGTATPAEQDPTLPITFDGVAFDGSRHPFGLTGVWVTRLHPFQRRYNDLGLLPVRPSWHPAGGRLVLSDGLQLLTWRPGDPAATSIPGTDGGTLLPGAPTGIRSLSRASTVGRSCVPRASTWRTGRQASWLCASRSGRSGRSVGRWSW